MIRVVLFAALLAVSASGGAMAQSCGVSPLSRTEINLLLTSRYACVGASPHATWNELHSGGLVLDYKLGPGHATDPSDTAAHPTGSYAITGPATPQTTGTVTYSYGAGGTFGYNVGTMVARQPRNTPGIFAFCGVSGGAPNLTVTVSASHC